MKAKLKPCPFCGGKAIEIRGKIKAMNMLGTGGQKNDFRRYSQ